MVERDTDIPIQQDNAGRVKGCEECVRGERGRIMLYHGFPLSCFHIVISSGHFRLGGPHGHMGHILYLSFNTGHYVSSR